MSPTRPTGRRPARAAPAGRSADEPRPRTSLGQHYLFDPSILDRIAGHALLRGDETVLEIGPGRGTLTRVLARQARKVVAIEIDETLADLLSSEGLPANVEIVHGDATRMPLPDFDKVVANLPYRISSEITFRLLERRFELGVLLYQREFARRLVARPGTSEYSRLTVNAYYRAKCEIVDRIPPGAFRPRPRVHGAVVRIVPREKPPFAVDDERVFDALVRACFSQRRKTLRNGVLSQWRLFAARREDVAAAVNDVPRSDERAEDKTPEELGQAANALARALAKGAA